MFRTPVSQLFCAILNTNTRKLNEIVEDIDCSDMYRQLCFMRRPENDRDYNFKIGEEIAPRFTRFSNQHPGAALYEAAATPDGFLDGKRVYLC
jgi:hypothetical protein